MKLSPAKLRRPTASDDVMSMTTAVLGGGPPNTDTWRYGVVFKKSRLQGSATPPHNETSHLNCFTFFREQTNLGAKMNDAFHNSDLICRSRSRARSMGLDPDGGSSFSALISGYK